MKLLLEPTDRFETIEGAPCRVWSGETSSGIPVRAFIRCVSCQTNDPEANAHFDKELVALPPVRREAVTYDLRFLVD